MKKNGFTLIEMLSVVIILTVLSLLIIPNVVNSIKEYQSTTDSLSMAIITTGADLYIDDYKNSYPSYYGNTYCVTLEKLVDLGYLKKPVKYQDEDITDLKTLKITYDDTYNYELVDKGTCISSPLICNPVEEQDLTTGTSPKKDENGNIIFTPGDEYICEVAEDVEHRFFVLNTNEDKINLIMYSNIRSDGEPIIETSPIDKGLVAWNNETNQGTSAYGPVTAMKYLHNATKHWTNVSPIDFTYMDRELQNIASTDTTTGYISFQMINGVVKITQLSGGEVTIGSENEPVRARLPIYSTDSSKTEVTTKKSDNTNLYLFDYLYNNIQSNHVNGIFGYWTLSSYKSNFENSIVANYAGNINNVPVTGAKFYGVRPVITITSENINY